MKQRIIAIGVWLTCLALPLLGFSQMNPPALPSLDPATTVYIENGQFNPAELFVEVGATVNWVNNDQDIQNITSADGFFSGDIDPGHVFSVTFYDSGTFLYWNRYTKAWGRIYVGSQKKE